MLSAMVRPLQAYDLRHKRFLHLGLRVSRQGDSRAPFTVPEFAYFPSALCAPLTVPVGPCQTARASWLLRCCPVNRPSPTVAGEMRRSHGRPSRGQNSLLGGECSSASPHPQNPIWPCSAPSNASTRRSSPNVMGANVPPSPHYPISSSSEGPANVTRDNQATHEIAELRASLADLRHWLAVMLKCERALDPSRPSTCRPLRGNVVRCLAERIRTGLHGHRPDADDSAKAHAPYHQAA